MSTVSPMQSPRAGREVYRDAITEMLKTDPRTVVLDSDTGLFARDKLPEEVRDRYLNIGIAEHNLMGVAAGMARDGMRPWVNTMATFASTRAVEAVKLDIAYPGLPVRIVATHAGLSAGHLGPTHHGLEDVGILRMLPSMTVVVPADADQTAAAVEQAAIIEGPVYLRLGRRPTSDITGGRPTALGRVQSLVSGSDVVLLACGPSAVSAAIGAAAQLGDEGVECGVVNVHTVKPLDEHALAVLLDGARLCVTVEEHWRTGGLGSAVAELVADGHPTVLVRVGVADGFVSVAGSERYLLGRQGIDAGSVAMTARQRLLDLADQASALG